MSSFLKCEQTSIHSNRKALHRTLLLHVYASSSLVPRLSPHAHSYCV